MDENASSEPPRRAWRWLGLAGILLMTPLLAPGVVAADDPVFDATRSSRPRPDAAQPGGSSGLSAEMQAVESEAQRLEAELQRLIEDLGPLADSPKYRTQIQRIQSQAKSLWRTRSLLNSFLSNLSR